MKLGSWSDDMAWEDKSFVFVVVVGLTCDL